MDSRTLGLLVVAAGIAAVLIGLLLMYGGLGWLGRLPGDFRWEGEHTRVYFPLASTLLVSALVGLILYVLRRLL
ncbi:MAG TPA: DUF2905 domain-containing protein [Longimicrobiaceae bacterium]|nr:DUF2905 domain-containing protein [Longimicrobiaceae bacterium]